MRHPHLSKGLGSLTAETNDLYGAPAIGRGQFNTGNMFTIQGQNYVFKLDTKPLSAGPGSPLHTITIMVTVDSETLSQSFNVALH